jgi:hypothetical protein
MSPPDRAGELRQIIDMSEEVKWPDPEPLFEPAEAERPYPLDALPRLMADAIREYQAYGQQPLPLIASSALASASLAAQGLADVARDTYLVGPISLYFVTIAISGERKTSADRIFNQPIREWVREQRETLQPVIDQARAELLAWQAEREGLLSKIKRAVGGKAQNYEENLAWCKQRLVELESVSPRLPIIPSIFHEDTNAARLAVDLAEGWPSASIWSDEAGLVIGSHGMNDDNLMGFIGLLNRLWDGNDFDRSRLPRRARTSEVGGSPCP